MQQYFPKSIVLLALLLCLPACRSAYYAAYEKVGVYKRALLKKRVASARDEQKEAQEEFKDALTRLKEMTRFDGGELERRFRRLQANYDSAASRVESVHRRIDDIETVARDLFAEWEEEIQQIKTESLAATSRRQLAQTRERYREMIAALKRAEASMDPVQAKLNDYVLALKHSLNAQAIASLQGESLDIQRQIARLIEEMNASIASADQFIKGLR